MNDSYHHPVRRLETRSAHAPRHIDPVHQPPTQQRIERIGVVGKNNLRHLRLRFAHWTRASWIVGGHNRLSANPLCRKSEPATPGQEFKKRQIVGVSFPILTTMSP